MPDKPEITIPGYYTTEQAARLLDVSIQRIGYIARHQKWTRAQIGKAYLFHAAQVDSFASDPARKVSRELWEAGALRRASRLTEK